MSVQGVPTAWVSLLDQMLPQLIESVFEAWDALERPFPDTHEDSITNQLCRSLRACRTARRLPFLVDTQMVELEPDADENLGRLDIVFRPTGLSGPPDERVYYCLECKRLQSASGTGRRSGASEYVVNGVMRFITGQYASGVDNGAMVGYVLDGDLPGSVQRIADNIERRREILRMMKGHTLVSSSIIAMAGSVWETRHERASGRTLCIHHLFVPAN